MAMEAAADCDVVVDALFGTGLARPLEGLFARVVDGINELPVPCVAVDLPSGLAASEPRPIGPHVKADLTVTFAAPKVAHVFPPAADAVGEMVVTDLGIPPRLVDDVEEEAGDLHLLMGEELADLLPGARRRHPQGGFRARPDRRRLARQGRRLHPRRPRRRARRGGAGDGGGAGADPADGRPRLDRVDDAGAARRRLRASRRARRRRRAGGGGGQGRARAGAGAGDRSRSPWRRSAASPWSARCRWCSTPTASTPSRAGPATSRPAGRRRS